MGVGIEKPAKRAADVAASRAAARFTGFNSFLIVYLGLRSQSLAPTLGYMLPPAFALRLGGFAPHSPAATRRLRRIHGLDQPLFTLDQNFSTNCHPHTLTTVSRHVPLIAHDLARLWLWFE